jgi:hypothetical protein
VRAVVAWARRHERLAAAGCLAVILGAWFPGLLIGREMGQSDVLWSQWPWLAERPGGLPAARDGQADAALVFHPLLVEAKRQLADGHLPVWNPGIFAGHPLLGDWQAGWPFPLNWPALLFGVAPLWGWIAMAKLLIAGLGTFALARALGVGRRAALASGAVYMLSAPMLVWLQWPLATGFALFPWLLLATECAVRSPGRRAVAGIAAAVGLSLLGGHPETVLLASSAAFVYLLVRLGAPSARPVLAWLAGHGLGLLISAAVSVPFLQAYASSVTRVDHGALAGGHLPLWSALVYALPNLYGDGRPEYAGPPLSYLIVAAYVGVAALLLAAVAIARHRRLPATVALAVMALAGFMVAFGIPPVAWVTEHLPPWSSSNNARVFFVPALAAAVGAGAGIETLQRDPLPLRRVLLVTLGAGALVGAGLVAASLAGKLPAERAVEVRAVLRFAVALALAGGCLAALGRVRAAAASLLVLLVLVADVAYLRPWNAVLPADRAYPPATAALRALPRDARVVSLWPGAFPPLALPPDTGLLTGHPTVQGYDFPPSERWADLAADVLGQRGLTRELFYNVAPRTDPPALAVLRALNVRYYLAAPGTAAPAGGMRRRYAGRDGVIWEDAETLPPAFVLGRERRLGRAAGLRALQAGSVDLRAEVLLEPGAPRLPAGGPRSGGLVPARVRRPAPDRLRVDVPAGGGGWLVVSESYWPFWRASVDGEPARLAPANHALMAVPLGPGAHRVELSLDRRAVYAGFGLSLLGLLACAWLAATGRARPRREGAAPRPPRPGARSARTP